MGKNYLHKLFIIVICLVVIGCTYYEQLKKDAELTKLAQSISYSDLKYVTRYLGKSPLRYSFKFTFENKLKQSYSLVFTLHDSSFPKSTLSYRDFNQSPRDSMEIGQHESVQEVLLNYLPDPNSINWYQFKQVGEPNFKDGYVLMQEFMRLNTRDV